MAAIIRIYNLTQSFNHINNTMTSIEAIINGIGISALKIQGKRNYYLRLKKEIDSLNILISKFNKYKNKNFSYLRSPNLSKIDLKEIKNVIIQKPYSHSYSGVKLKILQLNNSFIPLKNSLQNFQNSLNNVYLPFGGYGKEFIMRPKIRKMVVEALDIFSIGYGGLATVVIGKTLEKVATDYLLLLNKSKKINYTVKKISDMKLDNKINILHKWDYLTPSQYSKFMSIKWERNIYAHPSSTKQEMSVIEDSEASIQLGLNLIHSIEKKIEKLKKKK